MHVVYPKRSGIGLMTNEYWPKSWAPLRTYSEYVHNYTDYYSLLGTVFSILT